MILSLPLLGGLVVASVFVLPGVVEPEAGPELRNSVRSTLLQASGGLVLVLGAIATWRQLHINREGQITDRYTRAVQQLGAATSDGTEKVDVQLGGIYALERIAHDSSHDRSTIAEVLTAFVRHRVQPVPDSEQDHSGPAEPESDQDDGPLERLQTRLPAVQAAMTVLGRMPRPTDVRLDLAHVDLRGAILAGANLTGAHLWRANLTRADLAGANLTRAGLVSATLTGADLVGANLTGAHLAGANLIGVRLWDVTLTGADLMGADLTGAHLWKVTLTDANLFCANLIGARLWDVTLTDAELRGANLTGADLRGANLTGTRFGGGSLSDALPDARADAQTRWPEGFDPQAAGVVFEQDT